MKLMKTKNNGDPVIIVNQKGGNLNQTLNDTQALIPPSTKFNLENTNAVLVLKNTVDQISLINSIGDLSVGSRDDFVEINNSIALVDLSSGKGYMEKVDEDFITIKNSSFVVIGSFERDYDKLQFYPDNNVIRGFCDDKNTYIYTANSEGKIVSGVILQGHNDINKIDDLKIFDKETPTGVSLNRDKAQQKAVADALWGMVKAKDLGLAKQGITIAGNGNINNIPIQNNEQRGRQ